ncbi:polysaccharide deacetylase family protein [Candidatus Pseudothioglobus singularis]|jgi:peptidoglycan/xylan/chitin deacetylase (PgdA/CDA1 family)|nr:polysaccharide deacetylase family protein [Candidatus Pseudothioglobus singularis]
MLKKTIPILMYHSIEKMSKSTVMRSLHVPPRRFEMQMKLLNILGYKGLSMTALRPYLDGKKNGKVVGITFDDGYQNNLLNAAPILKKYNFSATCYLVSKRIGVSNIWDLDKGITQRPLMTQFEIQKWINFGLDIGAHTQTHAMLANLSLEKLHEEIFNCKTELEEMFQVPINDFCYPFGRFNEQIVKIVQQAGYKTATTMIRGRATIKSNELLLPRIPITHHTLLHLFLTKILTNYEDKK